MAELNGRLPQTTSGPRVLPLHKYRKSPMSAIPSHPHIGGSEFITIPPKQSVSCFIRLQKVLGISTDWASSTLHTYYNLNFDFCQYFFKRNFYSLMKVLKQTSNSSKGRTLLPSALKSLSITTIRPSAISSIP